MPDIKICTSSRPRTIFGPFQQSTYSLAVRDFTAGDMKLYV